ncbi:MAG: hypothetical protein ACYTHJ_19945, partial [Planctomycetota bacterium]
MSNLPMPLKLPEVEERRAAFRANGPRFICILAGTVVLATAALAQEQSPVSFSVNGETFHLPGFDGPPAPNTPYFPAPWFPPPPYTAGPTGFNRFPVAPWPMGIPTFRIGDVEDYFNFGQAPEAEIFQSEPDLPPAGPPAGTNNQIVQAVQMGLIHFDSNLNAYTFGEDYLLDGIELISDEVIEVTDELWQFREFYPGFLEPFVEDFGEPLSVHFGVDPFAIGLAGTAVQNQATAGGTLTLPVGPPGSADPEPAPGNWESDGDAAGDIFVTTPAFFPGANQLVYDQGAMAILGPRPIVPGIPYEDDLDALEYIGPNFAGEPGNTHARVNPIPGTHPPELGDPFMQMHEPINELPLIFSVDRRTIGMPGSAVETQTNKPDEGASGDLFLAVTMPPGTPFAGMHTNMLLIDEGMLGLMPHDDLDAVAMMLMIDPFDLLDRVFQAAQGFDPDGNSFGPGFDLPLLNPGEARVAFSVDAGSIGLVFTAVDYECRVDGMGLVVPGQAGSGIMEQAGDVFYSDMNFLPGQSLADPGTGIPYGQNYLWFEEVRLGLDPGAWSFMFGPPSGFLGDAPDDLNALDTGELVEPIEACCLLDGTCQMLMPSVCIGQSGTPLGPGSDCFGGDVACCHPGGSCVDTIPACCATVPGAVVSTYSPNCLGDLDGDGTDDGCECPCDADFNKNGSVDLADVALFVQCNGQQPIGQCAPVDLDCDGDIDIDDFAILHCQFYNPLPDLCCDFPTGACCLPNDECRQVTAGECANLMGSFYGIGTVCGAISPEACCLPDGTCKMADPFCCEQDGGTPMGQNSSCTVEEACCFNNGDCDDLDPLCCVDQGGTPQGPGTACVAAQEACCLPDGSCTMVDPQCCDDIGGTPQGPGTACAAATVACCLQDGSCVDVDPLCCDDLGGTVSPFSQVCLGDNDGNGVDDGCEQQQPLQACCRQDGTCVMLTHTDCVAIGGDPQGPGTDCTTVDCNPLKWAQPPTFNPDSPHPECFWGWDEYSVYGSQWIAADDWPCDNDK